MEIDRLNAAVQAQQAEVAKLKSQLNASEASVPVQEVSPSVKRFSGLFVLSWFRIGWCWFGRTSLAAGRSQGGDGGCDRGAGRGCFGEGRKLAQIEAR